MSSMFIILKRGKRDGIVQGFVETVDGKDEPVETCRSTGPYETLEGEESPARPKR
jgi:hypothetical protein